MPSTQDAARLISLLYQTNWRYRQLEIDNGRTQSKRYVEYHAKVALLQQMATQLGITLPSPDKLRAELRGSFAANEADVDRYLTDKEK